MYQQGVGVERNEETALRYFLGAANLGSRVGAFYCGKHALIDKRYDQAFAWLQQSANQDYGPSLLWLGLAHVRGTGVEVNIKTGVAYLERAAGTGNFLARRELALLMIRGKLGLARIPIGLVLFPFAVLAALVSGIFAGYSDKLMG
jgi:TPR repeat protein